MVEYRTVVSTCVIGAASLDKQLQGRELLWQREKNQSITWPKKFEEFHAATSSHWQLADIGLPLVSDSIWCLAPQQRETSCCPVNIYLFLATLSSYYPSLCAISPIQVLGSWEGSLGWVSPNRRARVFEKDLSFVLLPTIPHSISSSFLSIMVHLILFPCSIHPFIQGSSRGLQKNSELYQTQRHRKGFHLKSTIL